MSQAYKCDRCETFFGSDNPDAFVQDNYRKILHYDGASIFHLCPKCKKSFDEWRDFKTVKTFVGPGYIFPGVYDDPIAIESETYDSLNRQIAHYDDENKKLWNALDDISVDIAKVNIPEGEEDE